MPQTHRHNTLNVDNQYTMVLSFVSRKAANKRSDDSSSKGGADSEEELLFSNVIVNKRDRIQWPPQSCVSCSPEADTSDGDERGSFYDCHSQLNNLLPRCGDDNTTPKATSCSCVNGNNIDGTTVPLRGGLLLTANSTINPYRILQVRQDATKGEIKLAYRRLALFHHPARKLGLSCHDEATMPVQQPVTSKSENQTNLQNNTTSTSGFVKEQEDLRKKYVFEVLAACYETLICPESRRRFDIALKLGNAGSSKGSTESFSDSSIRYSNSILQKGLPAGEMFVGGKRIVGIANGVAEFRDPSDNGRNTSDVDAFYRSGYHGGNSNDQAANPASDTAGTSNWVRNQLLLQRSLSSSYASSSFATDIGSMATKSLLTVAEEEEEEEDEREEEGYSRFDKRNNSSLEQHQPEAELFSPVPPLSRVSSQSSIGEDEDRMQLSVGTSTNVDTSSNEHIHAPDNHGNLTTITSSSTNDTTKITSATATTCTDGYNRAPLFIAGCTGGGGGCGITYSNGPVYSFVDYIKRLFKSFIQNDEEDDETAVSTDDESNTSNEDEEPDIHYTQEDTNRLFGGPLAPLYRARKYQQFADPYTVFRQVFGSDVFPHTHNNDVPGNDMGDNVEANNNKGSTSEISSPNNAIGKNCDIASFNNSNFRHKMMVEAMETTLPNYIMQTTSPRVTAWIGSSRKMLDGTKIFTVSRVFLNRKVTRTVTLRPPEAKPLSAAIAAAASMASIASFHKAEDSTAEHDVNNHLNDEFPNTKMYLVRSSEVTVTSEHVDPTPLEIEVVPRGCAVEACLSLSSAVDDGGTYGDGSGSYCWYC